eukprot:scaffold74423_cov27-Tisochrysis_lutea.AAC.5
MTRRNSSGGSARCSARSTAAFIFGLTKREVHDMSRPCGGGIGSSDVLAAAVIPEIAAATRVALALGAVVGLEFQASRGPALPALTFISTAAPSLRPSATSVPITPDTTAEAALWL